MLYIKVAIKNEDGTNLAGGADVMFVNMPLSSLFADVQLSLNEQQIAGGNQLYPYRAMISALLQTNEGTKNHQLFTCGYVKETAGDLNDRTLDSANTKKD